jgi:predicted RNA-binding protein with TRAM domain
LEDRNSESDADNTKDIGYGSNYRSGFHGGRSRGSFAGQRPFRPAPIRVGEEYDVKIESISKRGDAGVAKIEGLVVFVAGTKIGDNVRIKISRVGRGYATAETLANTNHVHSSLAKETDINNETESTVSSDRENTS